MEFIHGPVFYIAWVAGTIAVYAACIKYPIYTRIPISVGIGFVGAFLGGMIVCSMNC